MIKYRLSHKYILRSQIDLVANLMSFCVMQDKNDKSYSIDQKEFQRLYLKKTKLEINEDDEYWYLHRRFMQKEYYK